MTLHQTSPLFPLVSNIPGRLDSNYVITMYVLSVFYVYVITIYVLRVFYVCVLQNVCILQLTYDVKNIGQILLWKVYYDILVYLI